MEATRSGEFPVNHFPARRLLFRIYGNTRNPYASLMSSAIRAPETGHPHPKRPVLIWVIALIVLTATVFSLYSLSRVPVLLAEAPNLDDSRRAFLESQTFFNYALALGTILGNLIGAVLLFLMRKISLYLFIAAAACSLVNTAYNIVTNDWLGAVGISGLVLDLAGWAINLAILIYVWSLGRRGVLR